MMEVKMQNGVIVALAAFALLLAAAAINAPSDGWENQGGVRVWTDPKTGCRYTAGEQGMSPLLGTDGKPDCARPQ